MSDQQKLVILTFVGMPGAGKSSCIEHVYERWPGLPTVLYFGGITMDEVAKRGLEVNEANERHVREDIRATEGKDAYAQRISAKADVLIAAGEKRIVVDGLYGWTEYKHFKDKYGDSAIMIAVTAHRSHRHKRLATRPVRPFGAEDAHKRDYAEIENLEKGGPIANADYSLSNTKDQAHLFGELDLILEDIGF